MNKPTYIEEALRRIDSEIFAEPNQMKIILQKELQGLGERIIEELEKEKKADSYGVVEFVRIDHVIDLIRSLTLPKS